MTLTPPLQTGAESLVRTLAGSGVELCFANPGTSEMHFVSALDRIEGVRSVLALFEGVATGAADGYYRMSGKPAATLLHLGPGLANGLANLHNARKARSGVVNIVGEHADYHIALDAPLTSDIEGLARPMSDWVKTCQSAAAVGADAAEAVAQARSGAGRIATLVLPANSAWSEGGVTARATEPVARRAVAHEAIEQAAKALGSAGRSALLLGGASLRGEALVWAGRIAARTGCRLFAENLNARMERGVGRVRVERLPYPVKAAAEMLAPIERLVLCGARAPVGFFAYPGLPSILTADGCHVSTLVDVDGDITAALRFLAESLDAVHTPPVVNQAGERLAAITGVLTGAITAAGIGAVLAAEMPDNTVVIDESITTGRAFGSAMDAAAPSDWLNSMGGSIGFGLPLALGAAMAAPDRHVLALEGDGSALYTPQALWSMARENARVTTIVFANRSYEILKGELKNVGAGEAGNRARDMLTLDRPSIEWAGLARSLGVPASQAFTLGQLRAQVRSCFAGDGPSLIEVVF
jgi:acetolactate synthase-1/2/3 large subunit